MPMNPKEFVEHYGIRSVVCCFSGGKDSLVATHYVMNELADVDIDKYVVYADTGIMLPIVEPYVREICQKFSWNLKVVYGNFFEKAEKNGMPRMKHRWCCYECKIKPINEFVKTLKPQRGEIVGLRRDESKKRSKLSGILFKKKTWSWSYAPILEWSEKKVMHYIETHALPVPKHYKLGIPETCQCGVFATKKRMLIIKAQFPEFFQKIVDFEAHFRTQGAAFYFQNKPVYAKDLAKQKVLS